MNRDAYRDQILIGEMQARIAHALYTTGMLAELAEATGAHYREFSAGYIAGGALIFRDHVHLGITGSNDRHDWVQNFNAEQVPLGPNDEYRVHCGFVHSAQRLLLQIHDARMSLHSRDLYIGGHSAGGAIAQILAIYYHPDRVVTFGCPRAFSPESAVRYAANPWRHDRYVRPGDPVPQLPWRTHRVMFGGASYRHSASPLYLTNEGLRTDEATGAWASVKNRAGDALAWLRAAMPWADKERAKSRHSMSGYLENMTQLAAEVSQ